METKKVTVDQTFYESLPEYMETETATVTHWYNEEGVDILLERKHMGNVNLSLTLSDIDLLTRIFADLNF
jgi:hypothetical protein